MPKTAVLFVHGIAGTPKHFERFLPSVPETCTIVNLLLEGHGGSVRDFSNASMKKWEMQVQKNVDALLESHDKLIIVGHSMGTLFAIRQAVCRPDKIKGLFLIASPLSVRLRFRNVINSIKTCLNLRTRDPIALAAKEAYGIETDRRVWRYIRWIPRYMELLTEIRTTRPLISKLNIPCVVVQSAKDEVVAIRSCAYFAKNANIKICVLPHSGHYYYPQHDWKFLQTEFTDFIKKTSE